MGKKLNNSAKKTYKNQISSYVSDRPKWLPSTDIWGPWDKYPGRRSCRWNQVTWYKSEQSDWFGINYHIGILVYRDLQSGYHQVVMHPDSKKKTAFISHAGLYQFRVLSFGLTNVPPQFQRLMARVLHGLEWKVCLIYIDDIIIFSRTFDEHLSRLSLIFDCLRQANVKMKPSKCHFAQSSVKFLEFVVSPKGILPDPDKISTAKSFPVPKSVKDVRSFLGLCNYYHQFVKEFAKNASPLNRLTRKDITFAWSPECATAFNSLKKLVVLPTCSFIPGL